MDKKDPFRLIKGGVADEPKKPETPIKRLVQALDTLTPEKKINLVLMMRGYFLALLKEKAKKSGRILSRQILDFVHNNLLDLFAAKAEVLTEMRKEFPKEEKFIISFLKDLAESSETE